MLCWSALWLLMALYSYRLSFGVAKSADQANLLLAGTDMFHGNWRLAGWSMVPDSYWTSDVPLGGFLGWLRRLAGRPEISPSTLIIEPALIWASLVTSVLAIAWRLQPDPTKKLAALSIALAAFGVPVMRPGGAALYVFVSGIHVLTILYAIAVFALGQVVLGGPRWVVALVAYAVVLTLGTLGDPLLVVIATLPVMCAVLTVTSATPMRRWALGLITPATAAAAKGLFVLNLATGGYELTKLPMDAAGFDFATFGDLGANAAASAQDLLSNFSADFTGFAAPSAWPELLHLPLALLAVGVVTAILWHLGRDALRGNASASPFIIVCLATGVALDMMALMFSKRLEFEHDIATARYIFPAWAFASILLGRFGSDWPRVQALSFVALAGALLFNATHYGVPAFPSLEPRHLRLLNALQTSGATIGCAGYWEGATIQVASQNHIKLNACIADAAGHLVPLRLANKAFSLHAMTQQDFVIVVRHPDPTFDVKNVLATFGTPARRMEIPEFSLLFYPRGTSVVQTQT